MLMKEKKKLTSKTCARGRRFGVSIIITFTLHRQPNRSFCLVSVFIYSQKLDEEPVSWTISFSPVTYPSILN